MTALRLVAYTPNGASLGPLPEPLTIQAGYVLNDVGALTLSYPPRAARADLLAQAPLEIATEVSWDKGLTWQEPHNARFLYLREGRDPIKTDDSFAIEAPSYIKRLEKALVGFANLTVDEGRREFLNATPGAILTTLWDEAQGRGALAGMTRTWTATQDTNGTPWPSSESVTYDPGMNLLALLATMADAGWVDFRTQGRSVQVYVAENPAGMAADRTLGALPVTLRFGRDLTEAPFRRTWEGLADTALVLGDKGTKVTRTNPSAVKPWGVQETFVTASGVEDPGTLNVLGDAALTFTERERSEHTFGLEFGATPHLPFRDYAPGEWVFAATDGAQGPQRMRVRQVTLTRDENGATGGNVVLNDRFLEADVLQNLRIQRILNGATQSGSGGTPSPVGPDILQPAQVTGLAASSAAYVEADGRVQSQVTLNWDDTTTNADGTPTTDVDHYEVWARVPAVTDWRQVAETAVSVWYASPFNPGETWEFQVRAVDTVFNRGAFSATASTTTVSDLVPPPEPSAPTATSRLGTARISWDGKTATATDMAATVSDFRYVSVHVDQVNGFVPSDANRVGELASPGYAVAGPLNYDATYYARLVAYDSSGNASAASAQVTIVVAPLVDVSNFPDDAMQTLYARTGHFIDLTADNFSANLIEGMWVKAGTLTADKLSIGTSGQSVVVNGGMEELNDAGTFQRSWERVYQNGAAPAEAVETAAPISGQRSMRFNGVPTDCEATWANDVPTPGYLPVVAGQVWYVRGTFRASRAIPSGKVSLRFHTAKAPSTPLAIFDSNAVWQYADKAIGTGVTVIEGTFTVPADHTRMRIGFGVYGDAGGVYDLVVDAIEAWPATSDSQITEVSAGKIKTGIVQATERIVAGSLTGARAELNGVGFQAFNPSGIKMFEVQANSGDTIIGDSGGIHIRLGAYTSAWGIGSGVNQGVIQFKRDGYRDGGIYSNYWQDDADQNTWGQGRYWSALRIHGTGDAGRSEAPAYLDLRSSELGYSRFHLEAQQAHMTANTFIMGGPANTVDFRLGGQATGWTFADFSSTSRLNIYNDAGQVRLRSGNDAGGVQKMLLNASEIELLINGKSMYFNTSAAGVPGFRHFGNNAGVAFQNNHVVIANWAHDSHIPIEASAFQVNSDPRLKDNAEPVTGALGVVRSIQAYDYDMKGILPRRTTKADVKRQEKAAAEGILTEMEANRARGVMADEVRRHLPDAVHEDDGGFLSISLYDLTATLWAAVRELAEEVATLKPTPSAD